MDVWIFTFIQNDNSFKLVYMGHIQEEGEGGGGERREGFIPLTEIKSPPRPGVM